MTGKGLLHKAIVLTALAIAIFVSPDTFSTYNLTLLPIPNSQFPIPNSQFPIPNSQFPIPNSQFPIPK
ncbi:MAG: hypothetical protein F6K41_40230 [Symploca sp. SIO3E6]|nr:hypothetical protein [Caldora sp. SIO3E6]